MGGTSPNSVYAVPLRFTHIAIATSHTRERCVKKFNLKNNGAQKR